MNVIHATHRTPPPHGSMVLSGMRQHILLMPPHASSGHPPARIAGVWGPEAYQLPDTGDMASSLESLHNGSNGNGSKNPQW